MVQCYYKNDNNPNLVRSINSGVCMGSGSAAGFFSCCFPWDECLPNGLCHAGKTQTYYTSLCTDQTLQDSACHKSCDGRYRTGVQYNTTDNLWACCDAKDPTCSTSTNLTFEAPAPERLLQQTMTIVDFLPTATGAATTAAATASISTTTPGSSASQNPAPASSSADRSEGSNSGLSTGAVAGISIAGVLVGIAITAGLIFWLLKRRKTKQRQQQQHVKEVPLWNGSTHGPNELPSQATSFYDSKLGGQVPMLVEAPSNPHHWPSTHVHTDRHGLHELT